MPARRLLLTLPALLAASILYADEASNNLVSPGDAVDYGSQAFYPKRWKEKSIDPMMIPWQGERVIFLTADADLDHQVMTGLLQKLDKGWAHYARLTGREPRLFKQVGGLPTMVAIPKMELTCGYGCGYVGATGIELGAFYLYDYKNIAADPLAIPDYYFYEMGRNYYTFGDKHSLFVTGFAVFMRYVCLDELGLKSGQPTRTTIEQAEAVYSDTDLPFIQTFTNHGGLSEKQNRLSTSPSDQPVMYASAMLRLRRNYGGDPWVERFFHQLATCPGVRATDEATAVRQSYNWFAAASCAAKKDLSVVFADEWRMPLTPAQRELLAQTDWEATDLEAGEIARKLAEAD